MAKNLNCNDESIIAQIHATKSCNTLQDDLNFDDPIAASTSYKEYSRKYLMDNFIESVAANKQEDLTEFNKNDMENEAKLQISSSNRNILTNISPNFNPHHDGPPTISDIFSDENSERISAISCPWNSNDEYFDITLPNKDHSIIPKVQQEENKDLAANFSSVGNSFKEFCSEIFEEAEEEFVADDTYRLEHACDPSNEISSFTGREGDEITFRASFIDGPLRNLGKPGHKISLDDYFKAKSYKIPNFDSKQAVPLDEIQSWKLDDQSFNPEKDADQSSYSVASMVEEVCLPNSNEEQQSPVSFDECIVRYLHEGPKLLVKKLCNLGKDVTVEIDDSEIDTSQEILNLREERRAITQQGPILSIPSLHVVPTAIVGLYYEETIKAQNNSSEAIDIRIKTLLETLNGQPTAKPCIQFDSYISAHPSSAFNIKFILHTLDPGRYEATLELEIYRRNPDLKDLLKAFSRKIKIVTHFEDPRIELLFSNNEFIDFGDVVETCTYREQISLRSQFNCSYVIALKLCQLTTSIEDELSWGECSSNFSRYSSTILLCKMPEDIKSTSNAQVILRAPNFLTSQGKSKNLQTELQVFYILPSGDEKIMQSVPIKVTLCKICINTSEKVFPVKMVASRDETSSFPFTINNASQIPMRMSMMFPTTAFSVDVSEVTIQPGDAASPVILYHAKSGEEVVESNLCMTIEPNGMELEIPFAGHCETKLSLAKDHPAASFPIDDKLDMSVSLQSTKTHFNFGCVSIEEEATQKLTLKNGWTSHELVLHCFIKENTAFKLSQKDSSERFSSVEITIKPSGVSTLFIHFKPLDSSAMKATLVCKPRRLRRPIKYTYPLQGFGGRGRLLLSDKEAPDQFSFGQIQPGTLSTIQIPVRNTGSRTIFLKFQITFNGCSDKKQSCIAVRPNAVVLRPNECKDVIIIASGTPSLPFHSIARIASLQVYYGNEVMRQRFRRSQTSQLNTSKLMDPELLVIDFIVPFSNLSVEEEDLPLKLDDLLLFYNDITKVSIPLVGQLDVDSLDESEAFIDMSHEQTHSSFCGETSKLRESSTEKSRNFACPPPLSSYSQLKNETITITPPSLYFKNSLSCTFCIHNLKNETITIEVMPSELWLLIRPQELSLSPLSSQTLDAMLNQSLLPFSRSVVLTNLKIMYEDGMSLVKVYVEPLHLLSKAATRTNGPQSAVKGPQGSKEDEDHPHRSCTKANLERTAKIEVLPSEIHFPPSKIGTRCMKNITFKNYNNYKIDIKCLTKDQNFHPKLEEVTIKPNFFLSLPIYFNPQCSGSHSVILKFSCDGLQSAMSVFLSGDGIP